MKYERVHISTRSGIEKLSWTEDVITLKNMQQ